MLQEGPARLRGVYRDVVRHADGRVTDRGWKSNQILDGFRTLLAAFVRGEAVAGIQGLLVGRGSAGWDDVLPPSPQPGDTALVDPDPVKVEADPKLIAFLDENGEVQEKPSPRIQVTVELPAGLPKPPEGETAYPLREFGLYATLGGEARLLNAVRHPVIWKQPEDILVRTIRLEF